MPDSIDTSPVTAPARSAQNTAQTLQEFPHLPPPSTPPTRRRYAIACRSSAIILDKEGCPEAADVLRAQASLLERSINPRPEDAA